MPASDRSRSFLNWSSLLKLLLQGTQARFEPASVESSETRQVIAELRVAEYQALTTRITYWITIQYSIAGIIAVIVLDFLKNRPIPYAENGLHVWAVVIAVEIFIGAYYYTLSEITLDSYYIENALLDSIRADVSDGKDFWGYGNYKRSNSVYSPEGMYLLMTFCIGAPCVALLYYRPWHRETIDFVFAFGSAILAYGVFCIARIAVLTQKRGAKEGKSLR